MKKLEILCMASLAIAVVAAGCSDATSPASRAVLVPVPRVSKIQGGPPDSTFNVSATPGSQAHLMKFTWDTWVTLESPGTITLISKPKLAGASNYYVEGGPVGATGIIDPHDVSCRLYLSVQDNYEYLTGFGNCAVPAKIDTLLSKRLQTPWITRAALPGQHPEECSHDPSVLCHSVDPGDLSTVRERPIPVTLNKLRVNKQNSRFVTHEILAFTASKSLDSIYFPARWNGVPIIMTFWQWIGADSTRNSTPPWWGPGGPGPCYGTASITCNYAPYESGRMIVKAYTGGWEQTSSVSVQCPVPDLSTPTDTFPYPSDSILNDTASDFGLRGALLEALAKSNADSAAGVGATAEHAGFRHEEAGTVRRWISGPDSGKYFFVPTIDPSATECHVDPLAGYQEIPGSILVAAYHVHPSTYPDSVYGCRQETLRRWQQYPGGPGVVLHMEPDDQYADGGGDFKDWVWATLHKDTYLILKDGTVFMLPHLPLTSHENNPYHWSAFGNAYDPTKPAGKCTWVKNFTSD